MKAYRFLFFLVLYTILRTGVCCPAPLVDEKTRNQLIVDNLISFARLFGYIKYFHPSYEASQIDWNLFALYGVKKIKLVNNEAEFESLLKELFLPLAPTATFFSKEEKLDNVETSLDTIQQKVLAWQHFGVYLGKNSNVYRSVKALSEGSIISPNQFSEQISNEKVSDIRLFKSFPKKEDKIIVDLSNKLKFIIPLTLPSSNYTDVKNKNKILNDILIKLNSISSDITNTNDQDIFIANTIITWNVIQHFYPYFDVVKVDWGSTLTETLVECFQDKTPVDFYYSLRKMMAKLEDGHGFVNYSGSFPKLGLPVRVDLVEDKVVVIASNDTTLSKGDIILNIGNKTSNKELIDREVLAPGASQLKTYLALLNFGSELKENTVNVKVKRENKVFDMRLNTINKPGNYFQNSLSEFNYPSITEIKNNVYYINVLTCNQKQFNDSLSVLSTAEAIIYDFRWTSLRMPGTIPVNPIEILQHLIDSTIQSPKWNVPTVIYPDRINMSFYQSQWVLYPISPKFMGKSFFLIDNNVISSQETCLSMVDNYKLGTTLGRQTAGCNGNVNFIPLLGGFEVMFTGMKTLKYDGSQHHLVGIKPNYFVERTIKAVKEGRDELLEKAIEVINKSQSGN